MYWGKRYRKRSDLLREICATDRYETGVILHARVNHRKNVVGEGVMRVYQRLGQVHRGKYIRVHISVIHRAAVHGWLSNIPVDWTGHTRLRANVLDNNNNISYYYYYCYYSITHRVVVVVAYSRTSVSAECDIIIILCYSAAVVTILGVYHGIINNKHRTAECVHRILCII